MTARPSSRRILGAALVVIGLALRTATLAAQAVGPAAAPASVQPDSIRVATGVAPDTVTVGQRYRAIARITVPPRARVEVSLVPADSEAVEVSAPVQLDTTAGAQGTWGATVGLVAWKTGAGTPVNAVLRVTSATGATREVSFPFAAPFVRSVLPTDTTGLQPKGPKDVLDAKLGTEHNVRLLAIGGVIIALLALLAYALLRLLGKLRRQRAEEAMDPRDRAIAALDRVAASGVLERGDLRTFYVEVSDAIRCLAAALSPAWGTDLTTAELSARMREDDVPEADRSAATSILERADLVKFARHQPSPDIARADLAAAREWVGRIQPPVPPVAVDSDASAETVDAEMAGSAR
jgi:hypothetical protein